MKGNKAQVTLFIIIAVIIIAIGVFSFFYFKAPKISKLPTESYFKDCVNEQVKEALSIAGLQAGYINLPKFESGSEYMPFSSQFNFLGMSIPYWFYVSGNNLAKEQRPELSEIEKQISSYLKEKVKECSPENSNLTNEYDIKTEGDPLINVVIKKNNVETVVNWPIVVSSGKTTTRTSEHKIITKSDFGELYDTASAIFSTEKNKLFLENYTIDVLRLYAPVTGVEFSCAPKIWYVNKVKDEIDSALEGNIAAIKASGSYYDIGKEHKYFEVDMGKKINDQVYFLYSRDMPHVFEVWPSENNLMRADPIGLQSGLSFLGAMGLCYVPYHFVYDLKFPVLIRIVKNEELFQFPVLVLINKNTVGSVNATTKEAVFDICQHKTQEVTIFTYDKNSRPLEANVSYKCFNQVCDLGKTTIENGNAELTAKIPQCYNGYLIAKTKGYGEAKVQSSSLEGFVANIFLEPIHALDLSVNLKGNENAIINFISKDKSFSIFYPDQKKVDLSEGTYNITAYLFKEANLSLEPQKVEKCINVTAPGISGIFGAKQKKCFELNIPSESLTNVLFGGGKTQLSFTESELSRASSINVDIPSFDVPKNINELGDIYNLIGESQLQITLR